jgi:anti-sigma regulatory factor (Ser/Thr protein kinase)
VLGLIPARRPQAKPLRISRKNGLGRTLTWYHEQILARSEACLKRECKVPSVNFHPNLIVIKPMRGYTAHMRIDDRGILAAWTFDSASTERAKQCRLEFSSLLRRYGNPESDFDAAELIFGELMANVVQHAPGPVSIRLEWTGKFPTLIMHDQEEPFAATLNLPDDPLRESGRGLFIIRELAVSLKVEDVPNDGTRVIVQLPIVS